jgi:hypothetical protein
MTRKHYVAIAKIIKDNTEYVVDTIVDEDGTHSLMINREGFINDLSNMFKQDNVLFMRDRFNNACNDE